MQASDHFDQHGGDFFPPPSAPRAASGGIRPHARQLHDTRRTWWARRWLAPLDAVAPPDRVLRGWEYARRGQVLAFDLDVGSVTARVQGSRSAPHTLHIQLAPFSQAAWADAVAVLASRAAYRAQLLAGELPDDAEAAFARLGLRLFPSLEHEDDLRISCSCADWAPVCRHAAAASHLLAEALDQDPFLVFALRGIERRLLLALLGVEADEQRGTGADEAELHVGATDVWTMGEVSSEALRASSDVQPPAADAPLIRILGPLPLWRGSAAFEAELLRMYRQLGTDPVALDIALGTEPDLR